MAYNIDENGVLRLSRDDIEQKAEEFITHFFPNALDNAQMTPIASIATRLMDEYKTEFYFDLDLGSTRKGKKIIGKFRVQPRSIFVDKSLDPNSPRWLFTLAHEMGHLVLHRKILVPTPEGTDIEVEDSDETMSDSTPMPSSFYEWTEWQANKFASSLLMPKDSFQKVVEASIEKLALVRNRGRIYLDHQPSNKQSLKLVLANVCAMFQTSETATIIRMKEFGYIEDVTQKTMKRINELLRED